MVLYGPYNLFFIERLNLWCPLFGVSFKKGSTVLVLGNPQVQRTTQGPVTGDLEPLTTISKIPNQ